MPESCTAGAGPSPKNRPSPGWRPAPGPRARTSPSPDDFVQGDARTPLDHEGQPDQRAVHPVFPPQEGLQTRFPPPGRLPEPEPLHQVLRVRDDVRHPLPDEGVAAGGAGVVGPAGEGVHVPVVVAGVLRGDEAAALGLGLDDDRRPRQAGDDPIAPDKVQCDGSASGRIVRHHGTARRPDHLPGQFGVLPGIYFFNPRRHHANGGETAFQRRPVGDPVSAEGEAADDARRHGGLAHGEHEPPTPVPPVRAEVPGAHHGDAGAHLEDGGRGRGCVEIESEGRVLAFGEEGRVILLPEADHAEPAARNTVQLSLRPFQEFAVQLVREFPVRPQGLPEDGFVDVEYGCRRPEMLQQGVPGGGHVAQRLVEGAEGGSFVCACHGVFSAKVGKRVKKQHPLWKTGVVSVCILCVSYATG